MEFRQINDNPFHPIYRAKTLLTSKQTVFIDFVGQDQGIFTVSLVILDKKKHIRKWMSGSGTSNLECMTTGKCGLEALLWAKNAILEFEKWIPGEWPWLESIRIDVGWADSRRKRVYMYGLRRHGYTFEHNRKCISKTICVSTAQ